MKFSIKHEIKGRIRLHFFQNKMSSRQADLLQYYLENQAIVQSAKVRERTCDVTICYTGKREQILKLCRELSYQNMEVPADTVKNSTRKTNRYYWDKLIEKICFHYGIKLFLPCSLCAAITTVKSAKYLAKGLSILLKGKIEVPVLDASAIAVSVLHKNYRTAGSVMFLLDVGELLEEWTHKKSVENLARSMALNISKVWLVQEKQEILVPTSSIHPEDHIKIHMGNMIPFDGTVISGEAMVNQMSLTGESVPVRKNEGSYVYAGTVVEEGEITVSVKEINGSSKYEKIIKMIEESEKLKSSLEGKAEHLADRLVPYTFAGTGLVWLLTKNITKALSVLMVDFSCALKLAMPLTVLSAIREANDYDITVKGGKYLETMADADTIVFDKTGTLTKAQPTVARIISFNGQSENELLKIAACLEEHFPHSMAKAVVKEAVKRQLIHEELHSKVEYIVAHGISSFLEDKKVIIGSYHFVFEDEKVILHPEMQKQFDEIPTDYSLLYMAINNELAAVICIEDPLREEALQVLRQLRELGIKKAVMMTGDSEHIASGIAQKVGLNEFYAEVLPEAKAGFIAKEKQNGHKVIMVGDGINDSPALSEANIGIAVSAGAEIAREVADVTIRADDLWRIVTLKQLGNAMVKRINRNYRMIIGINTGLILIGVLGIAAPTTSALLHNASTLFISVDSMKNLL